MKARRIERENFYFLSIVCFHHMEYGNGNRYYYINDHLFTPQKMIDTSGNPVWQADWDSFGTLTITINTVENNLRFPGQYYDSEIGFYYNFHRYYMPEVGRYLREDPAGGNGNYFYVNSNPVSFMDFTGLSAYEDCVKECRIEYLSSIDRCRRDFNLGVSIAVGSAIVSGIAGAFERGGYLGFVLGRITFFSSLGGAIWIYNKDCKEADDAYKRCICRCKKYFGKR